MITNAMFFVVGTWVGGTLVAMLTLARRTDKDSTPNMRGPVGG